MHTYALIVVLVGGLLGAGLVAYFRRRGRLRALLFALPVVGAIWLGIDFVITPQDRWLNGITLALMAVVTTGGFGYQWFRQRPRTVGPTQRPKDK
ncbi:hypothetical protein A5745_16780 [Mycobacterium sp. IS-2888]|uniref:hypothetical protein n=1 Tax=Mycobacterium sp. IS-2888 TaxID=1834159 RepID=UPI00096DC154|nr:hypothetical protein [Mycobacterium sp. IS-2888]OMC44091.1 hypothetical protein A5745_16780 [Mycobacterium sp. IS-2888]